MITPGTSSPARPDAVIHADASARSDAAIRADGPARPDAPALLLIGHGTRDAEGVAEFGALLAELQQAGVGTDAGAAAIGGGFIELAEPHVDAAIDALVADGATDIVAVPYVLFGAGHLKDDGPATLARARDRHPGVRFRLARDLGIHPLVLDVAEARARQARRPQPVIASVLASAGDAVVDAAVDPAVDPTVERDCGVDGTQVEADADEAVVLVSRGSTDPDATAEFVKFARLLQDSRGLGEVHPAFVAMAPPDVSGALERARLLGARSVTVVPLFLFTGVLVRRIAAEAEAWGEAHPEVTVSVAGHLGVDASLARVVVERYGEVIGGDVRMNCDVCAYRVRLPGYEDKVALPLSLMPHGGGEARGWRARRAGAQAEREAAVRRKRPRRGLGRSLPLPPGGDLGGAAAVDLAGLTYAYPDGRQVLNGVDLRIEAGERVALLGPNGAGKTTLVLHLLGVLEASSGRVQVAGLPVEDANLAAVRRTIGMVFQDPDDQLFSPTIRADVAYGPMHLGLRGDELDQRVAETLAAVGLTDEADRAPHHLSIGQRRRAALAAVLAMHPRILVLDEPTANLDPASRRDLADILRGLDLTTLMVTHDLSYALELCPRSVVLDSGIIAADGPTTALLASADTMAAHRLELPFGFDPTRRA